MAASLAALRSRPVYHMIGAAIRRAVCAVESSLQDRRVQMRDDVTPLYYVYIPAM